MRKFLKEYWDIFCANAYDGKHKESSLASIQTTLLLLSLFCFIMSLMYILIRDYVMLLSSTVLCALFVGTYLAGRRAGKQALPLILCMLGVMVTEGQHTVEYVYENMAFSYGWKISAACALVFLITLLVPKMAKKGKYEA